MDLVMQAWHGFVSGVLGIAQVLVSWWVVIVGCMVVLGVDWLFNVRKAS